ncbi:S8 family peptidase [Aquiflexum lacus]|uniref:S8 family peptidase n=1 Tax=Aquiflexum lacus TaxID=2483805 RepID=UPI00189575C0|nr:S8 family peptidase [Aquiflexum lacus]
MFKNVYQKMLRPAVFSLLALAISVSSCQDSVEELNIQDIDQVALGQQEGIIPGKFIVVLHDESLSFRKSDRYEDVQIGMRKTAHELVARYNIEEGKVEKVFGNLLTGFSVELSNLQLEALERDPMVKYVEPDGYVSISATQNNATWGLDRIDQTALPLNSTYVYNATGSGVKAYIIDTGIKTGHNEFGGRALQGYDAFGGNSEDCNGHGTHVAGTVGGTVYGVAKGVTLVGIRVLDCNGSGSFSGVIAGMDWVASDANGPSVANMSLGGGASTAVNDAVERMFNAGVPVIVAAGNGDRRGREQPACNFSPAGAARAYTVGATTTSDSKTSWSNYGDCVDIFAPGASITAAWYTSNTATNTISGTSMASPHVAGVAALYLQTNTTASSQAVYNFLTETSIKNIVSNSRTTNNHMLYSLGESSGGTDPQPEDPTNPDPEEPTDPGAFSLTGEASKVQGRWRSDLSWSGATTAQVDIYRDGTKIATVNNSTSGSNSYTDQTNNKGGGSLTYQVCEAGSNTCSSTVTLNF